MNRLQKVDECPGLVRDIQTNSIVNVDKKAYNTYKMKKEMMKRLELEEKCKEDRLNNLEAKVDNIDSRLNQILNILTNGNSSSSR